MVSHLSSLELLRPSPRAWLVLLLCCAAISCKKSDAPKPAPEQRSAPAVISPSPTEPHVPIGQPVAFWQHGRSERVIDGATAAREYLVFDLGEAWTPYLFADATKVDGTPVSSGYKNTYLALARGEFPNDLHGERAKGDKYLELYGILPTLKVVRARLLATSQLTCMGDIDLTPLADYSGLETYSSNVVARKSASDFANQQTRVAALMQQQNVATVDALDLTPLSKRDQDTVARYRAILPVRIATSAVQKRLKCEGYLTGRGKVLTGVLDWATHQGLAEFERRNRVFSWGYLNKDSLVPLRMLPMEADREGLLRVLTERAVHAAGVIEDGSTSTLANGQPRTWRDVAGKEHPIPNLVAALRETLVDAFGLQTPEAALAFLQGLGELSADGHRYVAIKYPALPEYYNAQMELTLDYDRGDVWYDFPFDNKGQEVSQPVTQRPNVTVAVMYAGQKIPLARFGTTIGGWRTESVNGIPMWKYKESPAGPRAWEEIVAAPVWLPPDSTPPEDLVVKNPQRDKPYDPEFLVNYHETGPSYASAYGLVVAYHRDYFKRADGTVLIGRDQGIRTHGSVDYMSIMRRHSHGCHRLHNHIALRLMSFVLAHRAHEHLGQESLGFRKQLIVNDKSYSLDIRQGGYVFKLATPLFVNVEQGRIRGQVKHAIDLAIPKWNADANAYVMPDGSTVQIRGDKLIALTPPIAAVPDSVPSAGNPTSQLAVPKAGAGTTLHTAVLPAEARR